MGGDARVAVVVLAAVGKFAELTEDAVVVTGGPSNTRAWDVVLAVVRSTPLFLSLSAMQLVGGVGMATPALTDVTWTLAGNWTAADVADLGNDPRTVDLMQTAADLGLSWAAHGVVRGARSALSGAVAGAAMGAVKAPMAPRYDGGAGSGGARVAGEPRELAAAEMAGVVASVVGRGSE